MTQTIQLHIKMYICISLEMKNLSVCGSHFVISLGDKTEFFGEGTSLICNNTHSKVHFVFALRIFLTSLLPSTQHSVQLVLQITVNGWEHVTHCKIKLKIKFKYRPK